MKHSRTNSLIQNSPKEKKYQKKRQRTGHLVPLGFVAGCVLIHLLRKRREKVHVTKVANDSIFMLDSAGATFNMTILNTGTGHITLDSLHYVLKRDSSFSSPNVIIS